jgi:prolyl oligopeptidase
MRKFLALALVFAFFSCNNKTKNKEDKMSIYPETKKTEHVDSYFGKEVADPYQWLENDMEEDVMKWVDEQISVTEAYLDSTPYRNKIKDRLTELWNYPKQSMPFKEGEYYYYYKNDGLQAQSVLYRTTDLAIDGEVFLDPNSFSEDGTISLAQVSFSNDAKYCAYAISVGGSDWNEILVIDMETGQKLDDHIKWVKFSGISWFKDGFYYSRYDTPEEGKELTSKNEFQKVYFHKVGTSQDQDELIYKDDENPQRGFQYGVTEDEDLMFISGWESTSGNSLQFKTPEEEEWKVIDDGFDFDYNIVAKKDSTLIIHTNNNASFFKLIEVNINNPAKENWKDFIPQKDFLLQSARHLGGKLILTYLKDASSRAYIFDLDGNFVNELQLPGLGTLTGFSGKKDENEAYFGFTSFTSPTTSYKYDIEKNEYEEYFKPEIDFDFDSYETQQVFFESKDGAKVPMFLTYKKGIEKNGNNPTMMYGYGGFNISRTPTFSISNLVFLENGGIYCLVNLRGGGEYGEAWHKAGMRLNKQNVFDDFISAAEYMIKNKYTSSEKIAMLGGSNGGLLVGACMTQRPDLYKVAIPIVGVLDMLKYHKFSIGAAWAEEYGSSEEEDQFENLLSYSPLHNVKEGTEYPATMVMTSDHDNRVVPGHSFKFIATLQEKGAGENPYLIRIAKDAGHGAGKSTQQSINEAADIWTFVFRNLGVEPIY